MITKFTKEEQTFYDDIQHDSKFATQEPISIESKDSLTLKSYADYPKKNPLYYVLTEDADFDHDFHIDQGSDEHEYYENIEDLEIEQDHEHSNITHIENNENKLEDKIHNQTEEMNIAKNITFEIPQALKPFTEPSVMIVIG